MHSMPSNTSGWFSMQKKEKKAKCLPSFARISLLRRSRPRRVVHQTQLSTPTITIQQKVYTPTGFVQIWPKQQSAAHNSRIWMHWCSIVKRERSLIQISFQISSAKLQSRLRNSQMAMVYIAAMQILTLCPHSIIKIKHFSNMSLKDCKFYRILKRISCLQQFSPTKTHLETVFSSQTDLRTSSLWYTRKLKAKNLHPLKGFSTWKTFNLQHLRQPRSGSGSTSKISSQHRAVWSFQFWALPPFSWVAIRHLCSRLPWSKLYTSTPDETLLIL